MKTRNRHRSSPHPWHHNGICRAFHDRVIYRLFRQARNASSSTRIKSRSGSTALSLFHRHREYPDDTFSVLRDTSGTEQEHTAVPVIFAACHIACAVSRFGFSTNCATSKATVPAHPPTLHRDEYSHIRFQVVRHNAEGHQLTRFGIRHGITTAARNASSSAIT